MEKQAFLDMIPESNEDWVCQQLLTRLSPTELSTIRRQLDRVSDILFKSWAKDMAFQTIHMMVFKAEQFNKEEPKTNEDGTEMEKPRPIRRRRDGGKNN